MIGVVLLPLTFPFALFSLARYRRNAMWALSRGYGAFLFWMRLVRLISYDEMPKPPAQLEGRAYVLVANHPTLIDVVFLLHAFPRLTSMVKASWYGSWMFGALLKSTAYLPGPGMPGDDEPHTGVEDNPVMVRMVQHLRAGHPLVVFPEGTRSTRRKMHRLRRGAFDAAVLAEVPILPVFIRQAPRILMKGDPFYALPNEPGRFDFEVLAPIETAGRSGRELRSEVQREFSERWEKLVADELAPAREEPEEESSAGLSASGKPAPRENTPRPRA